MQPRTLPDWQEDGVTLLISRSSTYRSAHALSVKRINTLALPNSMMVSQQGR